jgi:hypothetical protein
VAGCRGGVVRGSGLVSRWPESIGAESVRSVHLQFRACRFEGFDCCWVRLAGVVVGALLCVFGAVAGSARAGLTATDVKLPDNAESPAGPGLAEPTVWGVSCPATGSCGAMGSYRIPGQLLPAGMAVGESGGSWAQAVAEPELQDPSSISCGAPGDCTAVDLNNTSLVSETNGVWGAPVHPSMPADCGGACGAQFRSVSCVSAGDCVAVGFYTNATGEQPLVVTETSGHWSSGTISLPEGAQQGELGSVACSSAGNCTAVGASGPGSGSGVLLVSESNGIWDQGGEASAPAGFRSFWDPQGGNGDGGSDGVSIVRCSSAGNCTAVIRTSIVTDGFSFSFTKSPLLLTQSGGTWSTGIYPPVPPGGSNPVLFSLSCAPSGACAATGAYSDQSGTRGLLLRQSSNAWQPGATPSPADETPGLSALPLSVSCTSGGFCALVGNYYVGPNLADSNAYPVVLTETNGSWTVARAPTENHDGDGWLYSVSCASPGYCGAGGGYYDVNDIARALLVTITPNAPSGGGGGGGGDGGGGVTPSSLRVKITRQTISKKHHTAKFVFKSTGSTDATSFKCTLVKRPKRGTRKAPTPHFTRCKSHKTYKHLKRGKYTFEVRAVSRSVTGHAATRRFSI